MAAVRRKPWLAGVLSLCVVGLGQVYNGQALKGVLVHCLAWIVGLACIAIMLELSFAPWNIALPLGILLTYHLYILVDAITTARRTRDTFQPRFYNTWYIYLAFIVLPVFVIWSIRNIWIQSFTIPSVAMEKTLLVGDYFLVDKFRYRLAPPQHFEVIVFRYPWEEDRHFIKRIIALPGERVQLRDRQVYVNERPLQEPYTHYTAPESQKKQFGPVRVPTHGDTIEIRSDQRLYVNGEPVPIPLGTYYPRDDGTPMTGFAVFYGPLFPTGATLQKPIGPFAVQDDYYFILGDNRDNSKDSQYWGFVPRANVLGTAKRLYWSWDRAARRVRWERIGQEIR